VIGVDLDPRVEEMYHSKFRLSSLDSLPFNEGSFDLIVSEYVFEHLEEPDKAFEEMCRVLRPGGRLVVLTPNLYSYKSLAAHFTPEWFHHLMGGVRYGKGHEADMYPTQYKCNTAQSIKYFVKRSGLEMEGMSFITNGPTWFEKIPLIFEVMHLFHLTIKSCNLIKSMRCAIVFQAKKI